MTDENTPVLQFPDNFSTDDIASHKRLAIQLVAQMMIDPREQRSVVRCMTELFEWLDDPDGKAIPAEREQSGG